MQLKCLIHLTVDHVNNKPTNMAKCKNCGTSLGCSCQLRTASNGTACCSICLVGYERKISGNKAPATPPKQGSVSSSNTTPSSVKVLYKGPGVQLP